MFKIFYGLEYFSNYEVNNPLYEKHIEIKIN